jgi:Tol biopolymer transport system component
METARVAKFKKQGGGSQRRFNHLGRRLPMFSADGKRFVFVSNSNTQELDVFIADWK